MQFEDVAEQLAGVVDGSVVLDPETQAFIDTDLRCQAELARYRKLLRTLELMRAVSAQPPIGLLSETLATLSDSTVRGSKRAKAWVYAGAVGGAAAVAAGAAATAAVILVRSRRRAVA